MIRVPLLILILAAASVPAAGQEPGRPFLRTETDKTETVPGQSIVLRVTILAPTWFLQPPVFPSFEVPNVIVRLPARASTPVSERVGAETWSGVTRAYRIYPMVPGSFRISPQTVTVIYADPLTRDPVTAELRTGAVEFAGIVPAGAESLDPFIAAEALNLEQMVEGKPDDLEPGDAVTRTVTATVKGTSSIFVPPLIPPLSADGLAVYPREPVIAESEERGTVSGSRTESVTIVAEAGGRSSLPPIRLRWYNLASRQVETAEVPGIDVAVRGPAAAPPRVFDWSSAIPWIAIGITGIVLSSLFVRWLWPHAAAWRAYRHAAYVKSERYAFTQAIAALRAGDLGWATRAIDAWSMRLPPTAGPHEDQLRRDLTQLGSALYGVSPRTPHRKEWSNALAALADARHARLAAARQTAHVLPPLNPQPAG